MILKTIPCCSSSNMRNSEMARGPTRSNDTAVKGAPDTTIQRQRRFGVDTSVPSQGATLFT